MKTQKIKFSNFRLYEWLKKIVDSCENQGQANTCERLMFLATDKGLGHEWFVDLRDRLFQKEMDFAQAGLDATFDEIQKKADKHIKKAMHGMAKTCKDSGFIKLAKEILEDVEKYGEEK